MPDLLVKFVGKQVDFNNVIFGNSLGYLL